MKKKILGILLCGSTFFAALSLTSCSPKSYDMSNIAFNNAEVVYDGNSHSLAIEGTLPKGVTVTYSGNEQVNVGTYTVTASFTGSSKMNPIEDMVATLTIVKADYDVSGITFTDKTVTYTGENQTLEVVGTLPEGVSVNYTLNGEAFTGATNVGTYEVVANFSSTNANYNAIPSKTATLKIASADYDVSGITFTDKTVTYTGSNQTLEVVGTLPEGVSVSYTLNGEAFTGAVNPGTYEVVANFTGDNPNYNAIPSKTATLTIEKATYDLSGITFTDKTVTYTGENQTLEVVGTLPEGVSVNYTLNGEAFTGAVNPGTYEVVAIFTGDNPNYNAIPSKAATLTIEKATYDLSGVTFEDKTVTYDGTNQTLEVVGTLPEGVSVSYTVNGEAFTGIVNAGTYEVVANFTSTNENYNAIPSKTATLTIEKATFNISDYHFANSVFEYDGEEHIVYIEGNLPVGVSVSYKNNSRTNIGKNIMYATFSVDEDNYNPLEVSRISAYLEITKIDLGNVIEFNDKTVEFDYCEHSLEIKGVPDWVTVTFSKGLTYTEVGTYTVIASFVITDSSKLDNYSLIADKTATLTITPMVCMVTYDSNGGNEIGQVKWFLDDIVIPEEAHRNGYDFVEWTDASTGLPFDFSSPIKTGVTLVAKWEAQEYKAVIDLKGGSLVDPSDSLIVDVIFDQGYELPSAKREGYTFIGYYAINDDFSVTALNLDNWNAYSDNIEIKVVAAWRNNNPDSSVESYISASKGENAKITFVINNVGSEYKGQPAVLLAYNASEYHPLDSAIGLSNDIKSNRAFLNNRGPVTFDFLDVYICGESQIIEIDRYASDGSDRIYDKFYIVNNDQSSIILGPRYVDDIEAENYYEEMVVSSKKGIFGHDVAHIAYAKDLGAKSTVTNLALNIIMYPNECVDGSGNIVPLAAPTNDYIPFVSNGKTFYFRQGIVNAYDAFVKNSTDAGMKVTLIILLQRDFNQENNPYFTYYDGAREYACRSSIMAYNTSNLFGEEYWIASMEFLAKRYSCSDKNSSDYHGYVQSFVIGNEIDGGYYWNPMINYDTSKLRMETYMEEYYRTLRLANNAVKKYYEKNIVTISLTYCWYPFGEWWESGYYAPYKMLEWLNDTATREGNFDWGIAYHPYSSSLVSENIFMTDTTKGTDVDLMSGDFMTTGKISYMNIETLQMYLEQEKLLFRGNIRQVFLTEGGINCVTKDEYTEGVQAAALAYSYYKCENLSCITAFIYYKLYDTLEEGIGVGLLYSDHSKKASYEVYKYLDTDQSFEKSNPYLKYISYRKVLENGTKVYINADENGNWVDKNEVTSYYSIMGLFKGNFDWSTHWKYSEK